jgi:tRNA(fMet)-specific endonuclease VapC
MLKGEREAIDRIRSLEENGSQLSTTVINAYELLKGASISSRAEENLMKVRGSISNLHLLELSLGACEETSKIYKELREKGKIIGEFEILIAAIARFYEEKDCNSR